MHMQDQAKNEEHRGNVGLAEQREGKVAGMKANCCLEAKKSTAAHLQERLNVEHRKPRDEHLAAQHKELPEVESTAQVVAGVKEAILLKDAA